MNRWWPLIGVGVCLVLVAGAYVIGKPAEREQEPKDESLPQQARKVGGL